MSLGGYFCIELLKNGDKMIKKCITKGHIWHKRKSVYESLPLVTSYESHGKNCIYCNWHQITSNSSKSNIKNLLHKNFEHILILNCRRVQNFEDFAHNRYYIQGEGWKIDIPNLPPINIAIIKHYKKDNVEIYESMGVWQQASYEHKTGRKLLFKISDNIEWAEWSENDQMVSR